MIVFNAKIVCTDKTASGDDQVTATFGADYADGANAEWAKYTPALSLTMTLKGSAAELVEVGDHITVTFAKD
jgi:hypothetical protein